MTKNIAAVLTGTAVVALLTVGCATEAPKPLTPDVNDMPTGSFQGSYTGHTSPAPALPVSGSFKSTYTDNKNPPQKLPVDTSNDPNVQNNP
jgi:hypothetical protein